MGEWVSWWVAAKPPASMARKDRPPYTNTQAGREHRRRGVLALCWMVYGVSPNYVTICAQLFPN